MYELRSGVPNSDYSDKFGQYVIAVRDLDADGVSDLAVCAPGSTVAGMQFAGRVYLFHGRSGRVVRTLDGIIPGKGFGLACADVGDLDRDGCPDLLVHGADPTPLRHAVYAVCVGTAARWHTLRDFVAPIAIGDVDRDGWTDFTLTPIDQDPGGMVGAGQFDVVSGRDFSRLHRFTGSYEYERLTAAQPAGDVDGDGHADILAVSSGEWPRSGANGAHVFSGRTFALLHRFPPLRGGTTYGSRAAGIGDVDADGCDDIGVPDSGTRVGGGGPFYVDVFSGRTGALLFTLPAATAGLAPAGDVDGDGHGDFLRSDGSTHVVHSGRDQRVLLDMSAPGTPGNGRVPRSLGDVDGDDIPDACVGRFYDPNWATFLRVHSGAPAGIATLGIGCADQDGVVPRIGSSGSPDRGSTVELHLSRVHVGQCATLLIGFSDTSWNGLALPHDLDAIGMRGCALRTSVEVFLPAVTVGPGRATFAVSIPALPQLQGVQVFAQWLAFGRGAAGRIGSATRALRATIR